MSLFCALVVPSMCPQMSCCYCSQTVVGERRERLSVRRGGDSSGSQSLGALWTALSRPSCPSGSSSEWIRYPPNIVRPHFDDNILTKDVDGRLNGLPTVLNVGHLGLEAFVFSAQQSHSVAGV
jgi:hypothetical protein